MKINLKKFQNKKCIGIVVGILLTIILIITGVAFKTRKNSFYSVTSPENSRAASYNQFVDGDEEIEGTENVTFSAFFLRDINGDGIEEKLKGTCKQVGKEDKLYMELDVKTAGKVTNGKIQIDDSNFNLQTVFPEDSEYKQNYISNNTKEIEFKELPHETQKMMEGIVRSGDYNDPSHKASAIGNNTSNYSKVNSIVFTGIYVAESGEEAPIRKEIPLTIDWYGNGKTEFKSTDRIYTDLSNRIDEGNGRISLEFSINPYEAKKELIPSKNYVEGKIPELNGYSPIEVICTNSNIEFEYENETRIFMITRSSIEDEQGNITRGIENNNTYSLVVVYPVEAYTNTDEKNITIKVPVKSYYELYNNPNEEFYNPYTTGMSLSTITATYTDVDDEIENPIAEIRVGKFTNYPSNRYVISKKKPLNIYKGISEEENDDFYSVRWAISTGVNGNTSGAILKEISNAGIQGVDELVKNDNTHERMDNLVSNVGIGFLNGTFMLGNEGWIKVYDDETGNLIATFENREWENYTEDNPYRFETPVKHIRVQTSNTKASTHMTIISIKEIDDEQVTKTFSNEEFNNFSMITSTLEVTLDENTKVTDSYTSYYEAPYSVANIEVKGREISTQNTLNKNITIIADGNDCFNQEAWVNGIFLIKLPQEIIDVKINSITSNNDNVRVKSFEVIEDNGAKFIKIYTENSIEQGYELAINCNISPTTILESSNEQIELYALNEKVDHYYHEALDTYDINNNLNLSEKVNYETVQVRIAAPNSLLISQVASEYDDNNSVAIAPQIAIIKPNYSVNSDENTEAKVELVLKNNFSGTVSDLKVIGAIPFEGNKMVIQGRDANSNYTTSILEEGITIPTELEGQVNVFYSDKETPNKDITDTENNWKTKNEISDWSKIKTFLIDFNDYVVPTSAEMRFGYKIRIPNEVEINKLAYSEAGAWFSLNTSEGKYKTQIESNELGFKISEKYSLEISKYQKGKDKLIPGVTYKVRKDNESEEGKTGTTNENGKVIINNLYAEEEYVIEEVSVPSDYELNSNTIKFIGHVNNLGELSIEKKDGTIRGNIEIGRNDGEDYKVQIGVEDEVKARLRIIKTEKGETTRIAGAKYRVVGEGFPQSGTIISTGYNGEVLLNGLKIGEIYTIQELNGSDGFIVNNNNIKFKIVNTNGVYSIEIIPEIREDETEITNEEMGIKATRVEENENIPESVFELEGEKLSVYNLELTKIKRQTEIETTNSVEGQGNGQETLTYLQGARFRLYKDDKELGEYVTDENGKILIEGLYQNDNLRNINQTYVLKEVKAPDGYSKVKDISFKVEYDNIQGMLVFEEDIDNDHSPKSYVVDGNTIKLTVEDIPSFKLIKKDGQTGDRIAGIKFAIYNIDSIETPARDGRGEIVGIKESISGKEYYVVTTDDNGEITIDLPEGYYKAIEVETEEKYELINNTYYFGIGASRERNKTISTEWAKGIGGTSYDYIVSVVSAGDGGSVEGGYYYSSSIDLGDETTMSTIGSYDGLVMKHNKEGDVEWAKRIGGTANDYVRMVVTTRDGGFLVVGDFYSSNIELGNEISLSNHGNTSYRDGMIIKLSSLGEVEWAKSIGSTYDDVILCASESKTGGYIVGGWFKSSSISLSDEISISNHGDAKTADGMIIKLNSDGDVEWAKSTGGTSNEEIRSLCEITNGNIIVGGSFKSTTVEFENEISISNQGTTSYFDGMLMELNLDGETQWAKSVGGSNNDEIRRVCNTKDGGFVVGGLFKSSSIELEDEKSISNHGTTSYNDGMLIKFNGEDVEWARSIGGTSNEEITSIIETKEKEIIVGMYFQSSSIDLGNGINIGNYGNTSYTDGAIIKFDSDGETKWAKSIGGSYSDYSYSVAEINTGVYVVGGYFQSSSINLGNGNNVSIHGSTSYYDAMVMKISEKNAPVFNTEFGKSIGGNYEDRVQKIINTADGGSVAVGYFQSSSLNLGDEITINNHGNTNYRDGMVIKYDKLGKIEWAKSIGGSGDDYLNNVREVADGSIIIGGYFQSSKITLDNGTELTSKGNADALIVKLSSEGEIIWAKNIGGSAWDDINTLSETRDGGCIVGGRFYSKTITLENGLSISNHGTTSYFDGMIIKFNSEGEIEWASSVGDSNDEAITAIAETKDGEYIVGGYFKSSSVNFGNGIVINNHGNSGYADVMLIKINSEGELVWAEAIGGNSDEYINGIVEAENGSFVIGSYYSSSNINLGNDVILTSKGNNDGVVAKFNSNGEVLWAKNIGGTSNDYIYSLTATKDGGYVVGGGFYSNAIELDNGINIKNHGTTSYLDGMIIKIGSNGKTEWAQSMGATHNDVVMSVVETKDDSYAVGGYFYSSSVDLGNGININNHGTTSYSDGFLTEIKPEIGASEQEVLIVENNRKNYKITTDIKEIDGIKGGTISGEDMKMYEKIKYGDTSTKEIKITPNDNYEIISILVNGEDYQFEATEDGSYIMPSFENVTENKHIVATFSLKNNKIIINKEDSVSGERLPGTEFKLDQIEERVNPDNNEVFGELTNNSQDYYEIINKETDEIPDAVEELTNNGETYTVVNPDTSAEITGVMGELTNNGTYYFVEQDGGYIPTNGKTYRLANGGTSGIGNTTANSYISLDLTGLTGKYAVVINAKTSSEGNYDFGYAAITENTTAPAYNSTTGIVLSESGTVSAKDYTSKALDGGKQYYIHLGYRKDSSADNGEDQITFNSIKVYAANVMESTFNFTENEEKYVSTNQGQDGTVCNSYIPIDLTGYEGRYELIVNAEISSQNNYDYGYATITENTNRVAYNNSTGRFICISGTQASKDYSTILQGGKIYYLHLGYYKNASASSGDDKFTVNSVNLYRQTLVNYNFRENDGKYESTNQGKDNTVCNSYIPVDLTDFSGKYNIIVNAEISSQSRYDYGYATITENTNRVAYNNTTGRFICISGTQNAKDYSTVLQGGKMYYLHLGYYKNASTSSGNDIFTVNSVNIGLNDSELYHTTVETNSIGQAITQVPFGKYEVTETKAPNGYVLGEEPTIVEFRNYEGAQHEYTITDEKYGHVTVHHYIKGTETRLADDEFLEGEQDEDYYTIPASNIGHYELEKDINGNEILPDNMNGRFSYENQEVNYYYVPNAIDLTVHHYIEGTCNRVPLLNGTLAEDIVMQGEENEQYETSAIANEYLSDEYELVGISGNADGEYKYPSVEVTYYYKEIEREIIITNIDKETRRPLSNIKYRVKKQDSVAANDIYTTDSNGKIHLSLKNGTYDIQEIETLEGYDNNTLFQYSHL